MMNGEIKNIRSIIKGLLRKDLRNIILTYRYSNPLEKIIKLNKMIGCKDKEIKE